MSSAVQKTTKTYTYRSGAGGNTDVSIEYSADLSALSRLEVSRDVPEHQKNCIIFSNEKVTKKMKK